MTGVVDFTSRECNETQRRHRQTKAHNVPRSLPKWTMLARLGLTYKFAHKKLCHMIVFECIGKAWHAGMQYPAHWPAYPQLQDKENRVRHIASNAETAGKF